MMHPNLLLFLAAGAATPLAVRAIASSTPATRPVADAVPGLAILAGAGVALYVVSADPSGRTALGARGTALAAGLLAAGVLMFAAPRPALPPAA